MDQVYDSSCNYSTDGGYDQDCAGYAGGESQYQEMDPGMANLGNMMNQMNTSEGGGIGGLGML